MSDADVKEKVVAAVKAIKEGPRAMRMYMEMCAKCGTCASVCPVYFGKSEKRYNPAERTDVIRRIYRKHCTLSGRLFGSLETGNTDGANAAAFMAAIEFLEEEMKDEHGVDIKIPVDVEGVDYFHVPPSGDVLVNPEATMGLAKVFHVLGMGDKWTMSSKCFDGANYGLFTGNDKDMKDDIQDFRMNISGTKKLQQVRETGAKYLATACSNCKRQLTQLMEYHKEEIDVGGVHDMLSRAILINGKAAQREDYV